MVHNLKGYVNCSAFLAQEESQVAGGVAVWAGTFRTERRPEAWKPARGLVDGCTCSISRRSRPQSFCWSWTRRRQKPPTASGRELEIAFFRWRMDALKSQS